MKTLLFWLSIIVVTYSIPFAVGYFSIHPEAGPKLTSSILQGIGTAAGACISGALILRVKSIRRFIRRLFTEKDD